MIGRAYILICSICLITFQSIGQNSELKKSLKSVDYILSQLSNTYEYDIAYDVEKAKKYHIYSPDNFTIGDAERMIRKQTPFILEKIDSKRYLLIRDENLYSLCGYIYDPETDEMLSGALVSATSSRSTTDPNGLFEIKATKTDTLVVSYVGFSTKNVPVYQLNLSFSKCDTIQLYTKVYGLDNVVIRNYMTKGIYKREDASVMMDISKIDVLPGLVETDVFQSLQLLPGVNSPTDDPASLHIRGGAPDQNLVLLDDIRIYQTGHVFNQISGINPYVVDQVQVYRGGTSAEFGDRISGVIITDSKNTESNGFEATLGATTTHSSFYIKQPVLKNKLGMSVAGRKSIIGFADTPTFQNFNEKIFQGSRANLDAGSDQEGRTSLASRANMYDFYDLNGRIDFHPNAKNQIRISALHISDVFNHTSEGTSTANIPLQFQDDYQQENSGFSLRHTLLVTPKLKTNLQLSQSKYNLQYLFSTVDNIEELPAELPEEFRSVRNVDSITNAINTRDVKLYGNYTVSDILRFRLGYHYFTTETSANFSSSTVIGNGASVINVEDFENNLSYNSLFTEINGEYKALSFSIGARGILYNTIGSVRVEPRFFGSYRISNSLYINGSAELKSQFFTRTNIGASLIPSDQATLNIGQDLWILTSTRDNPDGFLQESIQSTLGFLWKYKGWHLDVEGYAKKISNIPNNSVSVSDLASSNAFFNDRIENSGIERRIGLDMLLKKQISQYQFWLGYSLSKSEIEFLALQENSFPSTNDQRHVFTISQVFNGKNFDISFGWNYFTGGTFSAFNLEDFSAEVALDEEKGLNSERNADYHTLNLSTTYKFVLNKSRKNKINGQVGFAIRNVYNQRNTIGQRFQVRPIDNEFMNEDVLVRRERSSLRLTPDFSVRFQF